MGRSHLTDKSTHQANDKVLAAAGRPREAVEGKGLEVAEGR